MFAKGSFFPLRSARRSATVTISAPLASNADRIASGEENLPVPSKSLEPNARPAIVNPWVDARMAGNVTRKALLSSREARSGWLAQHFPPNRNRAFPSNRGSRH